MRPVFKFLILAAAVFMVTSSNADSEGKVVEVRDVILAGRTIQLSNETIAALLTAASESAHERVQLADVYYDECTKGCHSYRCELACQGD